MKKLYLILFLFSLSISQDYIHKCGFSHNQLRAPRPDNLDYSTLSPSGNFRIHYDTSGQHAASNTYINAVGQAADDAKDLLNAMGFLPVIDDADEIFDIYLQNMSMGFYGYNSSDCSNGWYLSSLEYACNINGATGEVSGASFIVIDNNFDYSCSDFQTQYFCVDENSGIDVMDNTDSVFLERISISSTMGPGVKININSIELI